MKGDLKKTNAAILFSDIVGYTALMGEDQDLAFELINKNLKTHQSILEKHNGKLIKELGDGILCSFPDSQDAVAAAYELQKHYFRTKELSLRIGIHYGEVILDRNDVFGDAVNIASRLQTLGLPGSILFSKKIQEGIKESTAFIVVSKGVFKLKNVKGPIEIFALANEGLKIPKRGEMLKLLESRLRKFMAGAVILLTLVLTGFWVYHNSYIKQFIEPEIKSIAILPFRQINNGEENIRISEGLTLDLISHLSPISSLKVISKSSSDNYRERNDALSEIAEKLKVKYLLYGEVRSSKDSIFVNTELYDAKENKSVWKGFLKSGRENFFLIYTQILQKVIQEIGIRLTAEETLQLEKLYTKNINAFDYYLLGREYFYKYDIHQNQIAIIEFKKALDIDPNYALAWAGLADAFSTRNYFAKSEKIWLDSAEIAANKALEIDSNLAEGYKALSTVFNYRGDFHKSNELLEMALAKNPNYAQAIGNYASNLFSIGKLTEALVWQKRAAGLNPGLYIPYQHIGWTYRLLGLENDAIAWLNASLERKKSREALEQIGLSYLSKGDKQSAFTYVEELISLTDTTKYSSILEKQILIEVAAKNLESAGIILFYGNDLLQAKSLFEQSLKIHPNVAGDVWFYSPIYLAYIYQQEGESIESEILLNGALHLNMGEISDESQDTEYYLNVAMIYAIKGQKAECLQMLKRADDKKFMDIFKLTHNPIFESVSKEKEFKKIISRIERDITMMRQEGISLK